MLPIGGRTFDILMTWRDIRHRRAPDTSTIRQIIRHRLAFDDSTKYSTGNRQFHDSTIGTRQPFDNSTIQQSFRCAFGNSTIQYGIQLINQWASDNSTRYWKPIDESTRFSMCIEQFDDPKRYSIASGIRQLDDSTRYSTSTGIRHFDDSTRYSTDIRQFDDSTNYLTGIQHFQDSTRYSTAIWQFDKHIFDGHSTFCIFDKVFDIDGHSTIRRFTSYSTKTGIRRFDKVFDGRRKLNVIIKTYNASVTLPWVLAALAGADLQGGTCHTRISMCHPDCHLKQTHSTTGTTLLSPRWS